jgi:prepilin-type N-terminal cleavage/methylation domain-containing protein
MGRARAFTLIEVMICIALLAIFFGIAIQRANTGDWLSHESDYRFALRNARNQLEELRSLPFDGLPPQRLKAEAGGWVQLAHFPLVPDSLRCQAAVLSLDLERGRVQLEATQGAQVVVNYAYYLSDVGEAHTVPSTPPYRVSLRNTPVLAIERVRTYQGQRIRPATFRCIGDELEFGPELAGRVISVDYSGERIRNQVSGVFLSPGLQPSDAPTDCRLLYVKEAYGNSHVQLSLVRPR